MQAEELPSLTQESLLRILEVTRQLAHPYKIIDMLTEVVEAGKSVLLADRGSVWLYDEAQEALVMKVPEFTPPPTVQPGEGLVGECFTSCDVINVKDAYADERFQGAIDLATGYKTKCILNIPLAGKDNKLIGVLQLLNKRSGRFNKTDELLGTTLAAQCAVALQRTRLTEALLLKERLDEEVALAREIQISTLPSDMPEIDGYDVHGEFHPAEQAGGDLFDLVMLDGELFVLLGDATGHGFGPALSATQMQAMLRVAFRCGADLDVAYKHVNNQMVEDLPDDRFVTAFVGFLDPRTHTVRYHSGGQGPILLFRAASGECEFHKPTTFPVGILESDSNGKAASLKLEPGDVLALFSDGVYEFVNRQGGEFGEDRVAQLMRLSHDLTMSELCEHLMLTLKEFGNGAEQADDITIVIVKRNT